MKELAISVLLCLYYFGMIVFLVNCSIEAIDNGRHPGPMTLLVSVFWPLTLVACAIGLFLQHRVHRFW